MTRTASCLCGGVQLRLKDVPDKMGACHCSMCRKWSGGIYLGFKAEPGTVEITGAENITHFKSSDWAERGFCATCGSSLYYRITAPGPHEGALHLGIGLLDQTEGINLTEEIFIDEKPDGYAFAGDTHKMTGAEVFALFAPPE